MRSKMRFFLRVGLAFLTLGGTGLAYAEDPQITAFKRSPDVLRAAVVEGRKASFFCSNCHGDNGISRIPDVPNLAGQNPDYLLVQTRKFGDGQRKDEFMQGLIKVLSEEQKVQMSLFYATQQVQPGTQDPALATRGKALFTQFCVRCHGTYARGSEVIPRLAGQHTEYLVLSVTRYRNRTGERQDPLMFNAVSMLKDDQIKAIAAYLNTMP